MISTNPVGRARMIGFFFHLLQISVVVDTLPQYDGVLHQGEEDEHHAGQQPDLHRCNRVRDRDSSPGNNCSAGG